MHSKADFKLSKRSLLTLQRIYVIKNAFILLPYGTVDVNIILPKLKMAVKILYESREV